jgi:hypothetical protein
MMSEKLPPCPNPKCLELDPRIFEKDGVEYVQCRMCDLVMELENWKDISDAIHKSLEDKKGCLTCQKLKKDLDEADRRAGAAERNNEWLRDIASRRDDWLRQAKKDAGFHDNISFDVVWEKALTAYLKHKDD